MPLPNDAYPLATTSGAQIEAEFIRPISLSALPFNSGIGTVLDTTLVSPDDAVIFYTTQDCIISFTGVAAANPASTLGFLLLANERGNVLIPQGIDGISVIGLAFSGTLYIQKIVKWAGLVNPAMGVV